MIFCSRNEAGVPKWKLIQEGRATVTRRLKPEQVGKIRAVQPGRGKSAVCRVRIIGCIPDMKWQDEHIPAEAEAEARREGFLTWEGLWECLSKLHRFPAGQPPAFYRIEFELVRP